jgi:hypothetical protein
VLGIQLGDHIPRDIHSFAAGDGSRDIDLDWIHAGHVMNDDADRAPVRGRYRSAPFSLGKSFSESRQSGCAFLDASS